VKIAVRVLALAGMIFVVLTAVIEFVLIVSQTDPSAPISYIIVFTVVVLLYSGVILLDTAYLEWKQEVNYFITLFLAVIGIVGFSATRVYNNALVDIFFPRTSVPAILALDFLAIAVAGFFLPLLGRSLKPSPSTTTNSA